MATEHLTTSTGDLLTTDAVDERRQRPVYLQIAEALLDKIEDGTLAPGAPLPSKAELKRMLGRGFGPITAALDHLSARGYIVTSRGQVAHVADSKPAVFEDAARWQLFAEQADYRRNRHDDRGAAPIDVHHVGIDWNALDIHIVSYNVEPAPRIVAQRLGVPTGTPALRREFVEHAPGLPKRIRVSWLLDEHVGGTRVADPDEQPWEGGTLDELCEIDHPATAVEQHVRARHPTENERAVLDLPLSAPVLNITRIFWAGDSGVETSDVVTPAATTTFVTITHL